MKSNEIWKPIPHFEGLYEVSNLGRVKALKRKKNCNRGWGWIKEHIMKQTTANSEYYRVPLTNTRTTKFQMGVDYGNGDIQTIGTFELLPNKITNYKRKKKGKRYIIYKYELSGHLYFAGRYTSER